MPRCRRLLRPVSAAVAVLALAACGPIVRSVGPSTIAAVRTVVRYPVYWVGTSFQGLPLEAITHDPSGAYDVQYGPCLRGYDTCSAPLTVVTVPDPGFVPGEPHGHRTGVVRGVNYFAADGGRTLQIVTGHVVVSIFASTSGRALSAAVALRPIQDPTQDAAPVPGPLPRSVRGPAPGGPQPLGLPTGTTSTPARSAARR
jgi:hypothetical protein